MDQFLTYLSKWSAAHDSLATLQASYAVLAVVLFFGGAIVGLVDDRLGQTVVFFAGVAGLSFIGNGVLWAMVKTFVLPHLQSSTPAKTRKK